jgi:excisionase family DNA binding protein
VKATTSPEPVAPVKPQENPTAPTSGRLARPLEYAAALAVARAATKKRRTQPMTVTATIARPVMSRQEAAAYLGIALVTFHRLAQGGTIPHVIRGNRRAYLLTDLDAYLRGEAPRSDALRGWDKDPDRVAQGEAMNEARTRGKG